MAGIMQPIREPSPIEIENYSRIPQIRVSETAGERSNNYRAEQEENNTAQNNMAKLNLSKSYAHGLSNSAETVRFFSIFLILWKKTKSTITYAENDQWREASDRNTDNSLQAIFKLANALCDEIFYNFFF